jgi:hypothetical protein
VSKNDLCVLIIVVLYLNIDLFELLDDRSNAATQEVRGRFGAGETTADVGILREGKVGFFIGLFFKKKNHNPDWPKKLLILQTKYVGSSWLKGAVLTVDAVLELCRSVIAGTAPEHTKSSVPYPLEANGKPGSVQALATCQFQNAIGNGQWDSAILFHATCE